MAGKCVWSGAAAAIVLIAVTGLRANGADPPAQEKTPPQIVFSNPTDAELVHIDGKKSPELIPQWNAWENAFHSIEIVGDLPTEVFVHLVKDERAALLAAAKEAGSNRRACEERVLKLAALLQTQEAKSINDKTREINLQYRWQTLRLRDRVLLSLGANAQAAVNQWVESNKSGMQISIPRAELEFYRQPQ